MPVKFKTKELVFMSLIAALGAFLAFVTGAGIIAATETPATGAIVSGFLVLIFVIIGVKTVDKIWAATIIGTVMFTLFIPTIISGPPGIYKPVVGFITGLLADITIQILGRRKIGYIVSGAVAMIAGTLSTFGFMVLLGLPGVERLAPLLGILLVVYSILGAAGAYVGYWIYDKKLKNRAFVKTIQA